MMKVELDHTLPKEKAVKCAENIFNELTEKFEDEFSDLEQTTNDNIINFSFKIRGMNIKGIITVNENNVVIESKLPFAARVFQGLIESKIRENADEMMAKCM